MRWLLAFLACIGIAQAQIIQHQISDDGYARVPLQFSFPYYGRVFTESFMFSNGVVGFLNPTNSWCCTGFDLRTNNGTPFSFAIMPLQTDLLNYSGRFLTEGTPQYQRYKWENISEYGVPQNLNTFGVEIRPSGYIGMHYEQVNISPWRPVTIPQIQVSTTGTISVETPIVADRIVNEVITRPVNNAQNPPPSTVQSNATQAEPKSEKKQETKQAPKQTATAKGEIPTQAIPQPVHEYKAPIILDLAYQRMVKKPIQDNGKAMYNLIMNSQIKHEEMVDGQYRKGN